MALAQRTGGTLIVTNERAEEPVVLMGLSEYEALHDLHTLAEGWDEDERSDEETDAKFQEGDEDEETPFIFPSAFDPSLEMLETRFEEEEREETLPVLEQDAFVREILPVEQQEHRMEPEEIKQMKQEREIAFEAHPALDSAMERIAPKLDASAWDDIGGEERFYLEPLE